MPRPPFPARPRVLTLLGAGVVALAAAPDRAAAQTSVPATMDACYVPTSGTVYRINTPASPAPGAPAQCLSPAHVPFQWNRQGPAGPAGPTGQRGPTGEQGPAGFQAVRVLYSAATAFASSWAIATLACPTNTLAVGAGVRHRDLNSALPDIIPLGALPQLRVGENPTDNPITWTVAYRNANGSESRAVMRYIVCTGSPAALGQGTQATVVSETQQAFPTRAQP